MHKSELENCLAQSECLFNAAQIKQAIEQQAAQIDQYFDQIIEETVPLVLPVMNGGLIYAGQLLPLIKMPLQIDYIHATRYRNTTQGYDLQWKVYPQNSLQDRHVLLLDDILDEGHTLDAIVQYCHQQGAASVKSAVLVTKLHDRRSPTVTADFSALDVPDRYVFGYGMDFKGHLRNADGIYAVD